MNDRVENKNKLKLILEMISIRKNGWKLLWFTPNLESRIILLGTPYKKVTGYVKFQNSW